MADRYRQARPARRVDWWRVLGLALMALSALVIAGIGYGALVWGLTL